ncbi:MAG: hypothetical protein QHD01_20290 [Bradyrhizobium sp.]|uniref:hypothetical protein n=1 Tax=Bradyrhizobium sp. TaxID=376 RepID=UPI0029A4046B|nr:hypothetical protein [Bradyrhizobium sp.]MDX3968917.1 hypothetical protein [Bradyrhizobium sp.]
MHHLTTLRLQDIVPTNQHILGRMIGAVGVAPTAMNFDLAQGTYFRESSLHLAEIDRRYGGSRAEEHLERVHGVHAAGPACRRLERAGPTLCRQFRRFDAIGALQKRRQAARYATRAIRRIAASPATPSIVTLHPGEIDGDDLTAMAALRSPPMATQVRQHELRGAASTQGPMSVDNDRRPLAI